MRKASLGYNYLIMGLESVKKTKRKYLTHFLQLEMMEQDWVYLS